MVTLVTHVNPDDHGLDVWLYSTCQTETGASHPVILLTTQAHDSSRLKPKKKVTNQHHRLLLGVSCIIKSKNTQSV